MKLSPDQIVCILLWALWCALHSLLIALPVTGYLKKRLGGGYRFYRLSYNLVAVATLIPLALYTYALDGAPIFRWDGLLAVFKYLLLAGSLFLFIAGARQYHLPIILGTAQIRSGKAGRVIPEHDLFATSGILGVIRHPWYTAGIMIVWSKDFSLFGLLVNLVLSAYLLVGAYLEERKLLHKFGDRYREYQERVSMMLPCKWLRARISRPGTV